MGLLEFSLTLATLFCTLVAGIALTFAVVVMPGIGRLTDRDYIRAFQVIDGVIQAGQPVFGVVWLGSTFMLVFSTVAIGLRTTGMTHPGVLVLVAMTVYLLGVQWPTFRINVPLNNQLQALDVDAMDEEALASARLAFEARWLHWNTVRTVLALLVSVILMMVLLWL